jgi:hypothetical protein
MLWKGRLTMINYDSALEFLKQLKTTDEREALALLVQALKDEFDHGWDEARELYKG